MLDVAGALAARVVSFLEAAGGAAASDDLVAAFNDVQRDQAPLFKQVCMCIGEGGKDAT
jgi:hypothetical protein